MTRRLALAAVTLAGLGLAVQPQALTEGSSESHAMRETSPAVVDIESTTRRRPVRRVQTPPSSVLIDEALAAGEIDPETALTYKVFADFSDERLPEKYRGDDSENFEASSIYELVAMWDELSEETRQTLAPFRLQPFYEGSWWDLRHRKRGEVGLVPSDVCSAALVVSGWEFIDDGNHPDGSSTFRVWYEKDRQGDRARAIDLSRELETKIWPDLQAVMGVQTLSDNGSSEDCRGGSDHIDIVFVDHGSVTPADSCSESWSYMQIQRGAREGIFGVTAHELMHVIQYTFPVFRSCFFIEYQWLREATAQWAIDWVYPNSSSPDPKGWWNMEQRAAALLMNTYDQPLEERENQREYGAYLLAFFAHHKLGMSDFTKKVWNAVGTRGSLEAIDSVLPGGFEQQWPEFVRLNWNDPGEPGLDIYHVWDGLKHGVESHVSSNKKSHVQPLQLGNNPELLVELEPDSGTLELEHLTAEYFFYEFVDPTMRRVLFVNGMTYDVDLPGPGAALPAGAFWVDEPDDPADTKNASLQAMVKIKGQPWRHEDWTEVPWRLFCRTSRGEELEQLLIIVSNSSIDDDHEVEPPNLAPTIFATNIGCGAWTGTASCVSEVLGVTEQVEVTATWELSEPAGDPSDLPELLFSSDYTASGSGTWSISGSVGGCTYQGEQPFTFDRTSGNFLSIHDVVTSESPFWRHYQGLGVTPELPYVVSCGDSSEPGSRSMEWFNTSLGTELVSTDGDMLKGTSESEVGDDFVRCSWRFTVVP